MNNPNAMGVLFYSTPIGYFNSKDGGNFVVAF
jgi:isochorismate synthase EntC